MSRAQAERVEALLRDGPLDLGGDLAEQRPLLESLMTGHPLPAGVLATETLLGGVEAVEVRPAAAAIAGTILYLHGGAYALGSARAGAGLAAELALRTGMRAVSLGYRLAPEHPYPAALEDALAAYHALLTDGAGEGDVVVAGESAGGGLALALLAVIRDRGLPRPRAGVLLSPWADLTVSGDTVASHAEVDAALTERALRVRAADYAAGAEPGDPGLSPVFARYEGLPPLLVQVGSHEILLADALRVTGAAAAAHVAVTFEAVPYMPHVFQGFAGEIDEAAAALDSAAAFLRRLPVGVLAGALGAD